jgi:hypothetical protein
MGDASRSVLPAKKPASVDAWRGISIDLRATTRHSSARYVCGVLQNVFLVTVALSIEAPSDRWLERLITGT